MNPLATGASAGHAPLEGATKSREREGNAPRIVGRFAKMRRRGRKKTTRGEIHARIRGKGRKESKGRRKGGQAERPWFIQNHISIWMSSFLTHGRAMVSLSLSLSAASFRLLIFALPLTCSRLALVSFSSSENHFTHSLLKNDGRTKTRESTWE